MKRILISALALLATVGTLRAQEQWTLQQCIDYAVEHNITVQQMMLRSDDVALRLNTARNSRLPSLNASLGETASFGRGENREGVVTDNTTLNTSMGVSTDIVVFQGMRINNNIEGRKFDFQAALQDLEKAREDVSLRVTSYYLQVLLNKELVTVAEKQLALSQMQVTRSEELVEAGRSPESEIFESKAIVARDEMNLVDMKNALTLSMLDLAQALNLENMQGFDVVTPNFSSISMAHNTILSSPENIYHESLTIRPQILAAKARLDGSHKDLAMARSYFYPSISMNAGYGNSYYYSFLDGYANRHFFEQLKSNAREYIGLNISIPVFSRFNTRNSVRAARNNVTMNQLSLLETEQALRKEIDQSYYSADAAFIKYTASGKALEAAREAFRYEEIKAQEGGRSTLYEYNDAKTRMERSESEMLQAKFEYIFRSKVLDFYAGKPLDFSNY